MSTLKVTRLHGGPWGQNCFLVWRGISAVAIDPGGGCEEPISEILNFLSTRGLRLEAILNTHGHFDHIGGVCALQNATKAHFYLSSKEVKIMKSANLFRFIFKTDEKVQIPHHFLDLEDCLGQIEIANFKIECIPTPGHTPGGYCFRIEDHLFTGDTLLPDMSRVSRLPGGDAVALQQSIENLSTLPSDLITHPGHGRARKLGDVLAEILNGSQKEP